MRFMTFTEAFVDKIKLSHASYSLEGSISFTKLLSLYNDKAEGKIMCKIAAKSVKIGRSWI